MLAAIKTHRPYPIYEPLAISRSDVVTPYYFISSQHHSLEQLLALPYKHYLEIGEGRALLDAQYHIEKHKPDIALCMGSKTLILTPAASLLSETFDKRFALQRRIMDEITTCLQETIQNAIVHGNLGIASHFVDGVELEQYYEKIGKALENDPRAKRYVTICAWHHEHKITLSTTDQGDGFKLAKSEIDPTSNQPHGRGLILVRELCSRVWMLPDDNRTIYMDFDL